MQLTGPSHDFRMRVPKKEINKYETNHLSMKVTPWLDLYIEEGKSHWICFHYPALGFWLVSIIKEFLKNIVLCNNECLTGWQT
jgi:hypothetical protein